MKTNWQDPGTSEIISPLISGLQEAVGKIEDSIGLKSVAETGIPLTEVYISADDRYRIYQVQEGKRNWVASPAPVIYKNNVAITTGFSIDYGGGAIVLKERALSTDSFTTDFTRTNSVHSITPASIGAETPEGAEAKADAALAEANGYTDLAVAALAGDGASKTVKQLEDDLASHTAETAVLIPKVGSTANAIVLDIVLTDKKKGTFRASANNTGNMTINGKAFKKDAVTEIPVGGVKAGKVYDFYCDEDEDCVFILAKASGTAQPSDVLAGETFSNDDGEQVGTKDLSLLIPGNIKEGVTIDGVTGELKPLVVAEGETLIASANTNRYTNSGAMTKLKEIKVLAGGKVRVKFELAWPSGNANTISYACIYKNGSPVGTTRSTSSTTYTQYTEDITVAKDDLIQLYAMGGIAQPGIVVAVRNFQIYVNSATFMTVNQD